METAKPAVSGYVGKTFATLIAGYRQLVERARSHRVRVVGAT